MSNRLATRLLSCALFTTVVGCLPEPAAQDVTTVTTIVNGTEVEPGAYPWMVYQGGCGGTLIAENWVMTAAHCTPSLSVGDTVTIGGTNRDAMEAGDDGTAHTIAEIINHAGYDRRTKENDVALLRLAEPSDVTPMELDRGGDHTGVDAMAIGWGRLSYGGARPQDLQETVVPVIDQDVCYEGTSWEIYDTMICAGYPEGVTSVCHGDSGGPLVSTVTGELIGVVSWGVGCADAGRPGVYVRVSTTIDWVCENTSGAIADCPDSEEPVVVCDVVDPTYLGDGYCDSVQDGYNTEACGYDGGDCCESTCQDGDYDCGTNDFICLDPGAE